MKKWVGIVYLLFAMSSTIRNSGSSVGKIITTHDRDGHRWYSIYIQVQLRDLSYQLPNMLVSWPIVDGAGSEPTHAKKITDLRCHSFWLNKTEQGDFYTLDALSNSSPAKVWMWIINSLGDAALANAFDSRSVFSHVNTNIRMCGNGFSRNGSLQYDFLTLLQSFIPIPFLPVLSHCPLTRSQSEETLARLMAVRSPTTRSSCESELVYLREFTSSDAAPTHVGFVVTWHEPPTTIDVIRERFSPEALPFTTQASLRSAFLNIRESDLVSRFNEELRLVFAPVLDAESIETPTTRPPDSTITFVSATSELTLHSPTYFIVDERRPWCNM